MNEDERRNSQPLPPRSKVPLIIKRRQTQYFKIQSNIITMPPKPSTASGSKVPPRTDIGMFIRKLGKSVGDIQTIFTEFPQYEEQYVDHEKVQARQKDLQRDLEASENKVKQLEAAVAAFEGVHMNSSKALKKENSKLHERLLDAEERIAHAGEQSKASHNSFVKEFEKLIKEKRQEQDKILQDHANSFEKQKMLLEKQHLEILEENFAQLNQLTGKMQEQAIELEKLDLMNDGLKKKLAQSNGKLKQFQQDLVNLPDDQFGKSLRELAKDFHLFCKTRFMHLPQGSTVDQLAYQQQEIKERLFRVGFTDRIPFFIPTGNIEASKLLRLAGVEHLISESLCRNVFRSIVLPSCSNATDVFETISERLYRETPLKEAMWRASTVNALFEHSNIDSRVSQMVTNIFDLTSPLILEEDRENVKTELTILFKRAFETWRPAQKSCTRIFAMSELTNDSAQAWESHTEQDEFFGASEEELAEIDPHGKILCLFPRVYRESLFTAEKGVDLEDKGYVYYPGAALYADAGSYIVGQREHRDFTKLMETLSKKAQVVSTDPARMSSRRSRKPSMSGAPLVPQSFIDRTKKAQVPGGSASTLGSRNQSPAPTAQKISPKQAAPASTV